jgi:hypothetical protein
LFLFYTGRKYMSTHQLLLRNREEVENGGFVAVAVLLRWSFDFWFLSVWTTVPAGFIPSADLWPNLGAHRDGVVLVLKRNSSITFVGSWRLGPRSAIRDPGRMDFRSGLALESWVMHGAPREDPGPRGPHGVPGLDGLSVSDPGRSCREGSRNWNGTEPRPGHEGPGT